MTAELFDPAKVTVEEVLRGRGICSGYLPGALAATYMEIWEFQGYVYMVIPGDEKGKATAVYPLGTSWLERTKGSVARLTSEGK